MEVTNHPQPKSNFNTLMFHWMQLGLTVIYKIEGNEEFMHKYSNEEFDREAQHALYVAPHCW